MECELDRADSQQLPSTVALPEVWSTALQSLALPLTEVRVMEDEIRRCLASAPRSEARQRLRRCEFAAQHCAAEKRNTQYGRSGTAIGDRRARRLGGGIKFQVGTFAGASN
jgi:hypothetical protein